MTRSAGMGGAAVVFAAILIASGCSALPQASSSPTASNTESASTPTSAPITPSPTTSAAPSARATQPPTAATQAPESPATPSTGPTPTPLAVTNPDGPKGVDIEQTQLISEARALPDFAGVWVALNQKDLHVAVVGDLDEAAQALRPDVSADMTLFLHSAQYTYAELKNVADRMSNDMEWISQHGMKLTFISVDERENRVSVGIDPVDDATTRAITERYGEQVSLVYSPVGHVPVATWPVDSETLAAIVGAQPALITCGGGSGFPQAVIDDLNYPDAPAGPQRDALDDALKVFGMEFRFDGTERWRLATQTEDTASYLTQLKDGWIYAAVRFADGEWGPAGMGDCRPMTAFPEGLGPASWALDPDFANPTADATELHILVWEMACSGGSPATGRMSAPIVTYSDDALVMTIGVTPVGGASTCPGPPGTPAMVVLPEPLGDRTLLDGMTHPPAPPEPD